MIDKQEYIRKFRRCILEYTSPSSYVEEDGDDMNADLGGGAAGDAPAMGGAPGADPTMGGAPGADPTMGGAPGADPTMGGAPGADPAMGGDPAADGTAGGGPDGAAPEGGESTPPEGFAPQGVDPNSSLDGMGGSQQGDENPMGGPEGDMGAAPEEGGEDEEVIDVDELTNSQEETAHKVDALSGKFEKVLASLEKLEKKISDVDSHTNEYLRSMESEMEKRNPTPMQRMTMRSTKSAPYSMTPNEYMNNYAPDNYSDEPDNNGADDPQYKIMKSDIDNIRDYNSIAREFGGDMGLHDIMGN